MATDWKQLVRPNVSGLFERLRTVNARYAAKLVKPKATPKEVERELRKRVRADPEFKRWLKRVEDAKVEMMMSD